MGFEQSTVNNYEEMPQPTRYGAGHVNPFKEGTLIKKMLSHPGKVLVRQVIEEDQ
jgi:hypothetical protein